MLLFLHVICRRWKKWVYRTIVGYFHGKTDGRRGLPPVFLCTGKERRNESGTGFHDGKPFPTANCDMIEPGPVVRRLEVSG
jgi:hypothetical protein